MSEYGVVTEPGTVRIERLLPGPIERVWTFLTESEKRKKWLAAGAMDLRVGGKVELIFQHANLSSEKTYPEKYKSMEAGIRKARSRAAIRRMCWLSRGSTDRAENPT